MPSSCTLTPAPAISAALPCASQDSLSVGEKQSLGFPATATLSRHKPPVRRRTVFRALDKQGREAIRGLQSEPVQDRDLPRFLLACRDHVLCMTDSPGLVKSVADMASRPGDLAAFTHNCLKVLLPTGHDEASRSRRNHLRKLARVHGAETIHSSRR